MIYACATPQSSNKKFIQTIILDQWTLETKRMITAFTKLKT